MNDATRGKLADLSADERRALLAELLRDRAEGSATEHPLSHGQRALWFLHELAPESEAYNAMSAAHVRSPVDVPVLRRALRALVARHPMLRTTYESRGGRPIQRVNPEPELEFEVVDASGSTVDEVGSRLLAETARPFDLGRGPVARVKLFTLAPDEHLLLLTVHHIAVDFWSLDLLIDELRALYVAERTGVEPALPPVATSYVDYVRWQDEMLAGPEGERLWRYWRDQLSGDLAPLDLPTDRPRPAVQTYAGAQTELVLGEDLSRRLKALAREQGATSFMTLLAAFQVLLHRYTGQEDVLVGSPMAGRSRLGVERIVGYMSNPVVLRANLTGDPAFAAFLEQVRTTVLGALEHEDFPFPLLVDRLQPARDPSRSPLFQVMFIWDRPRGGEAGDATTTAAEGDLDVAYYASGQGGAPFDLMITFFERGDSFSAVLQYNVDLFDAATIDRMAGHFATLLEGVAADPRARVSELPLLTPEEREQVAGAGRGAQEAQDERSTLSALFAAQVARTPDEVALVFGEEQLTYRELDRRANRLANHLRGLGVGPGVLVGICLERSPELVVGLLGILASGSSSCSRTPGRRSCSPTSGCAPRWRARRRR